MIIACDVDNVLNDLQETVVSLFNQRYDTSYVLEDFHDYDIANDLSMHEATAMKEIYGEAGIYDLVKPLPGAQEGLQKLINAGHQVYLVTQTIPSIYDEKVAWLHHYFPFIDDVHIVSMAHKWLFKCDIMVEDNLQNLLTGHHYERICMNYPWNQKADDWVYDIYRCNSWDDIVNAVNEINKNEME